MADANKDEADKCKQIARSALAAGDAEKAVRFLQKAKRMCPGDASIEALLEEAASGSSPGPSTSAAGETSSEGPRYRGAQGATGARAATGNTGASKATAPTRTGKEGTYTSEQMQMVQRILRTRDYYDILDVSRDANEDAVKRAYKKLALKLHPDKNKAPGAEEAFKKLSKAVQCLTDEERKHLYDRYGDEERIPTQQRAAYQQDFMSADDLFAAFFNVQPPQRGHDHEGNQGQVPRAHLLQMFPVMMLILLTLGGNLFKANDGGSRFSFTRTPQYKNERLTSALSVNYFVMDEFDERYPEGTRFLADFERQVEIYYVKAVHSECEDQDKMMYRKVIQARRKDSQEELQKAKNFPRPKCKELERIKKKHGKIFQAATNVVVY